MKWVWIHLSNWFHILRGQWVELWFEISPIPCSQDLTNTFAPRISIYPNSNIVVAYVKFRSRSVGLIWVITNQKLRYPKLGCHTFWCYSDVTWVTWRLKTHATRLFVQYVFKLKLTTKTNQSSALLVLCEVNSSVTGGLTYKKQPIITMTS